MSFLPTPPPSGPRASASPLSSILPTAPTRQNPVSSFLPTAPTTPTTPSILASPLAISTTPTVHSPLAAASLVTSSPQLPSKFNFPTMKASVVPAAQPTTPRPGPGRPSNASRLAAQTAAASLSSSNSPARMGTPPHPSLASLHSPAHTPSLTSSGILSSISSSDLSSLAQTSSAFASIQSTPMPSIAAVRESNVAPAKELEQMFYGFGDDAEACPETLQLSQRYVEEFLVETTRLATRLKESTLEEGILYVIRNDRKKRARAEDLLNRWEQLKAARTFNDALTKEVATLPKELVEKE